MHSAFIGALWLSALIMLPAIGMADARDAVVKIYTTAQKYDYEAPWQVAGFEEWTGSGGIISGNRILTNAHIVSNATYIEVQRSGDPAKYVAEVAAVSHEADLALLRVGDDRFFAGIQPLELDGLPELLDGVVVYGFPEGGDGLSVTKGIVSRIERIDYAHSFQQFLGLQIDAAINSGNSGGPVLKDGKIVGVAMQHNAESENIGYIISTPIIQHFLSDIADGQHDGFPDDGLLIQSLENPMLRSAVSLPPGDTGVYVSYVIPGTAADGTLLPGDVILEIDGHPIANDGSILLRPGLRVSADFITTGHQVGDTMKLTIWRQGKRQNVAVLMKSRRVDNALVRSFEYDVEPEYYILAGMVFMPLSFNSLAIWGENWTSEAPAYLLKFVWEERKVPSEQVVYASAVLKSPMTAGYEDVANDTRIVSVNGKSFATFKEFASLVDNALRHSELIELQTEDHRVIVVSSREHRENESRLLEMYGIGKSSRVRGLAP